MKNIKLLRGIMVLILLLLVMLSTDAEAQCAMCKASLESDMKTGGNAGRTINIGILFLLGLPYIIVGSIAYVWLRNRKIKKASMEEQVFSENV